MSKTIYYELQAEFPYNSYGARKYAILTENEVKKSGIPRKYFRKTKLKSSDLYVAYGYRFPKMTVDSYRSFSIPGKRDSFTYRDKLPVWMYDD